MNETETPKKKTVLFLIIGVALLALLGGAAFMAGRLLGAPAAEQPSLLEGIPMGSEGGPAMMSIRIEMIPAPELPQTDPEMTGAFSYLEDNSLFITDMGGMGMIVSSSSGEGPSGGEVMQSNSNESDSPPVEVVVTRDTVIYMDATQPPSPGSEVVTVQQIVAPGTIDEIGENSIITVWGVRTGDRIVADVLLYSNPVMMQMPLNP